MKKFVYILLIISIIFTYINTGFAESTNNQTTNSGSNSTSTSTTKINYEGLVNVPTDIAAGACILIDAKTGQVLFEKDSKKAHMFPASTTKMLTGAIAFEKGDLEQMMTASKAAVNDIGKDGMNIGIMPEEQISLGNLLNALLISSANETANIIAENLCSTRQDFVDMMNQKAVELGCEGTHFTNPCGAHNPDHYTTAADLAKMAKYAMTLPKFRETVKKISYQLEPTNKHTEWPVLYTTNKLLRYPQSDAPYTITGLKTGYTGQAGSNLVSSAENSQGMELIAVVMNVTGESSSNRVIKYSRELFNFGFSNFIEKQMLQKGQIVQSVSVIDAVDDQALDLVAGDDFKYIDKNNSDEHNLTGKPVVNADIKAPVRQGDLLGYLQYEKNGEIIGKIDLVASRAVEKNDLTALQNAAKSVNGTNPFKKVIIILLTALVFFLLLRFSLKQVSRRLKAKRYKL